LKTRRPARAEFRSKEPERAAAGPRDARRGTLGFGDERTPLDEIARGVAADGELGEEHQVGPLALRAAPEIQDLPGVSGKIADRRVDLRDGDLHGKKSIVDSR